MNPAVKRYIFFVGICLYAAIANAQVAKSGVADLTSDTVEREFIYLNGEWKFYWDKLDLRGEVQVEGQSFVRVPGSWSRGGRFPLAGHATYQLRIKLPRQTNGLAIYFPLINSAAKFFINGKLIEETGTVSADPKVYKPALQGTIIPLQDNEEEVDLVVQVANYSYFSAGILRTPYIGKATAIMARIGRANGVENFFAGSLIAMFVYQFILFFLYQRGKPYLWLSLICLGVAVRALIVHGGSFLLPNLYPTVDWEIWKKLEFASVYGISALFPLYVFDLFKPHAPRKPVYFFVAVAVLLCGIVIVTPQLVYGKLLDIAHLALLLGFIYAVYAIAKAWNAGNRDARIILFGVLASFPFILMEILQNNAVLPVSFGLNYLVELGVLVFLIFQVYLLAHHYAVSYSNLEKIVEERTDELSTANTVKDRLLSVVSHDIKSPLNSLRGVLHLYNSGAISQNEFDHFSQHLEGDLNKTTILVENILYWTASQLKGVQLREETFDLHVLIEENVQLFSTIARGKKLTLIHHTPKNFIITTDRNILNLVLRNLLSNAIKFSFEGGAIDITTERSETVLNIHVKDNGMGMDEAAMQNLSEVDTTVSTVGTKNEKGTGLGLALCKEYLSRAGGTLSVKSAIRSGSTFTISLPL